MYIDLRCAKRTLRIVAFHYCVVAFFAPLAVGQPRVEMRPVNNGLNRPIDAPIIAGAVITGNKITLVSGGVNVEMELLASDWGTSNCASEGGGPCTLGAVQGTIDSTGYLGLNASPPQPGVDLNPLGNPGNRAQGAFIVTSVCAANLRDCTPPQPVCAGPEGPCVPNDRWVVAGFAPIPALATSTLNYEYLAANGTSSGVPNVPASDAQNNGYFGSLIVQIPAAAATTYSVGFVNDTNFTYFQDEVNLLISDPVLVPGQIQIVTGSCCTNLGPGSVCTEPVTQAQCNSLPSTNAKIFRPGVACSPCGCILCPLQQSLCSDQNSCTRDFCIQDVTCGCVSEPDYDVLTECCNPNGGATIPLSDNNPCTTDVCNSTTGQVSHNPNNGAPCVDSDPCTLNDVCTGTICRGTPVSSISCDSDADCTPNFCNQSTGRCVCTDFCPDDPNKAVPGVCGCGVPDVGDADADGTLDCVDVCPGLEDYIFAPDCVPPIPTVSGWGLVIIAILLLTGGKVWFGRSVVRKGLPK